MDEGQFKDGRTTLMIVCEEGEESIDIIRLDSNKFVVRKIEDEDDVSEELLRTSSAELVGASEEELARFSDELFGVSMAEEESASTASLLRCSWLSGISATEELDAISGPSEASLLFGLLLSGSTGPIT